jgi:hypothetical protein
MSRPKHITDIDPKNRFVRIAMVEFTNIAASPALLKAYAALLDAAEKAGGHGDAKYNNVDINIPKTKDQLENQLAEDQRVWDSRQRSYNLAVLDKEGVEPLKEWEKDYIKEWAEKEGLPNPFDVFAANNEELQKIRAELELINDFSE